MTGEYTVTGVLVIVKTNDRVASAGTRNTVEDGIYAAALLTFRRLYAKTKACICEV